MIDYDLLKQNVMNQISDQVSDDSGIGKLVNVISEVAVKATIIALKEYDNMKSTED